MSRSQSPGLRVTIYPNVPSAATSIDPLYFPLSRILCVSRNFKYLSFTLIDFDGILMKSYLRSNIYAVKKLASSYLLSIGSQSLKKLAPSDGEIFGDEIGGESNHGTKKNKKTGQWLIANYITNFNVDIVISNIIANYEKKSFIWHLTEGCSFIRLVVALI